MISRNVDLHSLVKGRIHKIDVLFIEPVLRQPQPFSKSLEVDDLAGPQELDHIIDVRIIGKTQDVVIGDAGLLFCCACVRTTFFFSKKF